MTGLETQGGRPERGPRRPGFCSSCTVCPRSQDPHRAGGRRADGRLLSGGGSDVGRLREAGVTEAPPEDSGDLLAGRSPITSLECARSVPRVSIPGSTLPPSRRPGGRISNRATKTLFGRTRSWAGSKRPELSCFLQASTNPLINDRIAGVTFSVRPGRGWDEVMCRCCRDRTRRPLLPASPYRRCPGTRRWLRVAVPGPESLLLHGSLEIPEGDRSRRTAVTHEDTEPGPPPTDQVPRGRSRVLSASVSSTVRCNSRGCPSRGRAIS